MQDLETRKPLKNWTTIQEDRPIEKIESQLSPLSHYDVGRRIDGHNGAGIQIDSWHSQTIVGDQRHALPINPKYS